MRALMCLVAVLSLAWAGPLPAQAPPPQPARDTPAAATAGTAVIRGRVVDAATGRPLSRVEMRAGPNAPQFPGRIVMTDGEGRYEIKGDTVIHHIDVSFFPNLVGRANVRKPTFQGKRLILTTEPDEKGGVQRIYWERVDKA